MVSPHTMLMYGEDIRDSLDSRRERTFHEGWEDAIEDGPYTQDTFNQLSWQNLGNRLAASSEMFSLK